MSHYIRIALDVSNKYEKITELYGIITSTPRTMLEIEDIVSEYGDTHHVSRMYEISKRGYWNGPIVPTEHGHFITYGLEAYNASGNWEVLKENVMYYTYVLSRSTSVHGTKVHAIQQTSVWTNPIETSVVNVVGDGIIGTLSTNRVVHVKWTAATRNTLSLNDLIQLENAVEASASESVAMDTPYTLYSLPTLTDVLDVDHFAGVQTRAISEVTGTIWVYLRLYIPDTAEMYVQMVEKTI